MFTGRRYWNEYRLESEVEEDDDFIVSKMLADVSTSTYVPEDDVGIQNVVLT